MAEIKALTIVGSMILAAWMTGWMCRWVFGGTVDRSEEGVEDGAEASLAHMSKHPEVGTEVFDYDRCGYVKSPTGNMSPCMRRRGVRRGVRRVGEVSHYAKMHSRTRYRI